MAPAPIASHVSKPAGNHREIPRARGPPIAYSPSTSGEIIGGRWSEEPTSLAYNHQHGKVAHACARTGREAFPVGGRFRRGGALGGGMQIAGTAAHIHMAPAGQKPDGPIGSVATGPSCGQRSPAGEAGCGQQSSLSAINAARCCRPRYGGKAASRARIPRGESANPCSRLAHRTAIADTRSRCEEIPMKR